MSLFSFYRLLSHSSKISNYDEDIFIAAKQISQYTIAREYIDVSDELIYIDFDEEENKFYLDHRRIVKAPGYEILLFDIDSLSFEINNNMIYMSVVRDKNLYQFLLTYAKEYEYQEIENEDEDEL